MLIVEDEPKIAALLRDYLQQAGYVTDWVGNGDDVAAALDANLPDLMLLDLMLPGKDGISICRETLASFDLPIVIVTARVEEIDRLLGLEIGADDYICKPFSPREVVARVRTILRRVQQRTQDTTPHYRGLAVDADNHRMAAGDRSRDLTKVECQLLLTLLAIPGKIYTREQLMKHVYPDGRIVSNRTMDTHVKNLRRKLDELYPGDPLIHSVYGAGYRLE